jgi:Flp pilus assembly protein TadG
MKQIRKDQPAQSLVEMAISLMVILMLLLGAVEISMAIFQYITIRDAAQEGAIYASLNPKAADETNIKTRAIEAANDVVQLTEGDITITRNNNKSCEGLTSGVPNTITVTIVYYHDIIFPLVGPMIGTDSIRLTGSVTETILQPLC